MSSQKKELPTIKGFENGPFEVTNLKNFTDASGNEIQTEEVMYLCRCGGSKNKPFCDGTHNTNGYTSKRDGRDGRGKRRDYAGKDITIHDNRRICAHAQYCAHDLPSVFREKERPWIEPDGAAVDETVKTIKECPSGALSYSIDGVEYRDEKDRKPAVKIMKDGPYNVVGYVKLLETQFGDGASKEHYSLCRCGASKNKPFCDGNHRTIGFKG